MSDPSRAVFLSYASQDAGAARRIRDALMAAGIAVWVDQSELRGGDVWDQRIRREIRDCTLFVPLISRNTQARTEGYFRLEWHLADRRTQLMAKGRVFLVPVCIDDTLDADAEVPDSFAAVQWTHLPDGEISGAFVEQVTRLLSPDDHRTTATVRALTPTVHPVAAAQGPIPEKSIAVLPFLDMSAKKDQEHFSDGLAEALIDLLTQVRDLRVPARTSSFYFKGKSEELATIAEKLRVTHILEGSVRKAGNTIRVTAQLIRADSGYHLWSKTYDRDAKDIFRVQDEIAAMVVEALKAQLLPSEGVINQHRTASTAAYEQYLLGKYFYNRNTVEGYLRAAAAAQQAIALDPNYASAYAMLSFAKTTLAMFGVDAEPSAAAGILAADKAVALAPGLPEAYAARGHARMRAWNWAGAQADYEKALQLDPNDAASQGRYGVFLAGFGRFEEAIAAAQRSVDLEPLNSSMWLCLGFSLSGAGQDAAARAAFTRMLEITPESSAAKLFLAQIELREGRAEAALKLNSQQTAERLRLVILAMAEHTLGHAEQSRQALDKLLANPGGDSADTALVYAWRGEADQAFEFLETAYRQHSSSLWAIRISALRTLRSDPRYKVFLRKMNLPE
jgi:TolB-like protein/Tfp pilus assembly protein PilF